jgi:transposase
MAARPAGTTPSPVGLAALDGAGITQITLDDALVSLRLLCDRREEPGRLRTQAVCRLHRLLAELTPGGMRGELCASKAGAVLVRLRPDDEVGRIRLQLARDHLADITALGAKMKAAGAQIAAAVAATGSTLTSLFGIGPVIAGRLVAEAGDVARFATKDKFASYNGTPRSTRRLASRPATGSPGPGTGGSTTRCT